MKVNPLDYLMMEHTYNFFPLFYRTYFPFAFFFLQVDEEGNPVRKKRTNFQRIYSSLRKAAKNNQIEKAFGIDLGSRGNSFSTYFCFNNCVEFVVV